MSPVLTPAARSFSITSRTILERRMGFRLAVGNDLDPDDVARLEEVFPGFDGIGGAGQFFHAFFERGLDRRGVAQPLRHIAGLRTSTTWPGIKSGRGQLAQGVLHVAAVMGRAA